MRTNGKWRPERGTNPLDTGAHFYDVYECADGTYISVGSIEPQFYAELLEKSGLGDQPDLPRQMDREQWPAMKQRLAEIFKARTRQEWCEIMEHSDVCFAPVLSPEEAVRHPHNVARGTFVEVAGLTQAGPAPRFSRTEPEITRPAPHPGQHSDEILDQFGFDDDDIAKLHQTGAVV
jgi:alpha-methylacyl-CoA racemase